MIGKRFGRLIVISKTEHRYKRRIVWLCKCDCGNDIELSTTHLNQGWTKSCGCLKNEMDQNNLRKPYNDKRINGVAMQLFNDKPRSNSSTGYRGVFYYDTRQGKPRYGAGITVNKKKYRMRGFLTAKDAYYNGRLILEDKYLPKHKK